MIRIATKVISTMNENNSDVLTSNLLLTHIVPFHIPWQSIAINRALSGDFVIVIAFFSPALNHLGKTVCVFVPELDIGWPVFLSNTIY